MPPTAGKSSCALNRAFHRIFRVTRGHAAALVGPALVKRFPGFQRENDQEVVSVTNVVLNEQTWYNTARPLKPQTFRSGVTGPEDPFKDPTSECDFCRWQDHTAEDTFGRIESDLCVSGSNLFKYCEPCHGVILFKHHDPLTFTQQHVREMLQVSSDWFSRAHNAHPDAQHPFFIWNCLARAGASQYHGHAQVMLSKAAFPTEEAWRWGAESYAEQHGGTSFYHDLRRAYASIGLLSLCGAPDDRVSLWPSISPIKDMEITIMCDSFTSATFAKALHAALRTLIDDLQAYTFNVGIFNIPLSPRNGLHVDGPVIARVVSRGKLTSSASDFGGLEVFGRASIGHTDPFAVHKALQPHLQGFISSVDIDSL